ncbi:hypothetical protein [Paraflavitalea speifideaquila]|uniref:hypothetical protein n=1 Tax=Paraflavitalea speifideaquila TaxID=3076558 RepID=UPI0028E1C536|nr:hypothetical protein [Paraflavitalea speifideiaquila]
MTEYKEFIIPYESEVTTFINQEFPKGYDTKDIKIAGQYTLAFLYYLTYDRLSYGNRWISCSRMVTSF